MATVGRKRRGLAWTLLAGAFAAEVVIFTSIDFSRGCGESFAPSWAYPALAAPFLLAVFGLGAAAFARANTEVFVAAALLCGSALLLLVLVVGPLGEASC
jgi:hypothetical protein